MADSEPKRQIQTAQASGNKLKYLDLVRAAAIYTVVCFTSLYEFAKENSGPLKAGVHAVEGIVRTVIGPVYVKFHDVPFELLKFVDRKVDELLNELYRHVPSLVKQASSQARAVACDVQRAGVVDAAKNVGKTLYVKYEPAAREVYNKYEPVVERYAVSFWRSLNRLPVFPQIAQIIVPTAAYWSEKYNQVVYYAAQRWYPGAAYLPLIPIERIAKVFNEDTTGPPVSTNSGEAVTAHH
ncbi:hypothetical protein K2173_026297 [Erythroxylum novogranatense]|uniref:Stress-related protein n=1 Tax=Erythroxylum novogranatense TaxID=1862640 RepID=A0AAV8SC62_9ROSI|nr:hypothetical protein K2173_026297 [Erythroxylum novogranatense]